MLRHALAAAIFASCISPALAQTAIRDETAADAKVIENLKAAGSDLRKPHPTRYYFYFRLEQDARAAAAELQQLGYIIENLGPGPRRTDWAVLASKPAVPSIAVVTAITHDLNALARKHSGIYDGWEAAVTK